MGLENPLHIMIILAVVLMVFGAKKLPEMGKGLGEGMRGFKDAISGQSPAVHTSAESLPAAPAAAVASQPVATNPEIVTPVVVAD